MDLNHPKYTSIKEYLSGKKLNCGDTELVTEFLQLICYEIKQLYDIELVSMSTLISILVYCGVSADHLKNFPKNKKRYSFINEAKAIINKAPSVGCWTDGVMLITEEEI